MLQVTSLPFVASARQMSIFSASPHIPNFARQTDPSEAEAGFFDLFFDHAAVGVVGVLASARPNLDGFGPHVIQLCGCTIPCSTLASSAIRTEYFAECQVK